MGSLTGWVSAACAPFPICNNDEDCAKPLVCNTQKGNCEAECSTSADCQGENKACVNLRCVSDSTPAGGLSQADATFLKRLKEHIKFTVDPKSQQVTSMTIGSNNVEITLTPGERKIWVKGANLHLVNGMGKTDEPTKTNEGAGNLIIGYNETNGNQVARTGSHNLVIGTGHSYESYGGIIGGVDNTSKGPYASVIGGQNNLARERTSVVLGGQKNQATNKYAVVCGGAGNKSSNEGAVVVGGQDNTVFGYYSAILGGKENVANGNTTAVLGGNKVTANKQFQTVLGNVGSSKETCDNSRVCK